jgi:hypothetical protein
VLDRFSRSSSKMKKSQREQNGQLLFCFNCLFLFVGVATLIGAGVVIGDEVGKISGKGISTGLMLIGALIMFLAAAGAQATRTAELTKCALYYIVVLTFTSMATAVLCLLVFRVEASKENLSNGWDIANLETRRDIQEQLECCGFNLISDRVTVPCQHLRPCEPELEAKVDTRMGYMKVFAFLLLSFEIIGLILTCCLLMKRQKQSVHRYTGINSGTSEASV